MKYSNINTENDRNIINNGYLFSQNANKKYLINLDWLQFKGICQDHLILWNLEILSDEKFYIEKHTIHNNPNYHLLYKCYVHGEYYAELYSIHKAKATDRSEVSVRINNKLLYDIDRQIKLQSLLNHLNICYKSLTKIAIAVDADHKDLPIINLCRRYIRNDTVHINNKRLTIEAKGFDKPTKSWSTYEIGKRKYQKFVRAYDKSLEVKQSVKDHILSYWQLNELNPDNVVRFELELGSRHLKKYSLTLEQAFNQETIINVFTNEVKHWLSFYYVKLAVQKRYKRKDTWIKHSKKIKYIDWDLFPKDQMKLEDQIELNELHNPKRSITFSIKELRNNYKTSSAATLNFIYNVSSAYDLDNYVDKKFNKILYGFDSNIKNIFREYLYDLRSQSP